MKRLLGQAFVVGAIAIGALAVTPACADNDQSIFIRYVMAPPQNRQNGVCIYLPDSSQPFLSEGVVDTAVRDTYQVTLLVGSQLMPRGDQSNTRAESNRTHLNGAVVKVTDANGGSIREFTSLGSGFVDIGQNNTASYGLIGITALDAPALAAAAGGVALGTSKLVISNIKVYGKTLGGVDVESGELQFPIRVCNQCLLDFSTGDDPAVDGKDCNRVIDSATAGGGGAQQILPCNPGQDEVTPCQTCRNDPNKPACRGQ